MPVTVEPSPPLSGLSPVDGKPLIARFDGGQLSSDGGLLVLREVERRLGIADRLAACITTRARTERVRHGLAILRFRMLMIAAGFGLIGSSNIEARQAGAEHDGSRVRPPEAAV